MGQSDVRDLTQPSMTQSEDGVQLGQARREGPLLGIHLLPLLAVVSTSLQAWLNLSRYRSFASKRAGHEPELRGLRAH